ncbi:nicotinate (nicotinamide) nucleotide adenylyltransferase [Ottowia sp. GY511]|uniref:Probable nicotinate-nucleotide adenylyltransferase n=1 Tax=Ottowia flava TaxID=2675430 RepID=A0ABW4KQ78_9BURK|nr:nicotinate-nucleotide adenylyltransferase [Ottowia sp. GY511]TXK27819.1 nicotinate (nicotinamide) nucleotide adenylyltransferase [Ottowia sp. GY511]
MGVRADAPLQRVGVFGGAFDPPHEAHVALARAAIAAFALDHLLIVPTGDAWHKSRPLSPAADRLAMCQLAFANLPQVLVDDRELRRDGPTYTIDTLTELRAEWPGAELFLQIGADQAAAFHTWRRAQDIVDIATISIAARADVAGAAMQLDAENPLPSLRVAPGRVRVLPLPPLPHSATEVRRRVAARLPIDHLVAPAVAGYIAKHHLYSPT